MTTDQPKSISEDLAEDQQLSPQYHDLKAIHDCFRQVVAITDRMEAAGVQLPTEGRGALHGAMQYADGADSILETRLITYVEMIIEHLDSLANNLEVDGVEQGSAANILLAGYYRKAAEEFREAMSANDETSTSPEPQPDGASTSERVSRRSLFGIGAAAALIATLGSTASMQASADVTGAGDAAIIAQMKLMMVEMRTSAQTRYAQLVEQIQRVKDLYEGLNTINQAFVRGVDSLLTFNDETAAKQMVAQTTAADRQTNVMLQIARNKNELASKPGAATCIQDGGAVADKAFQDQIKQVAEVTGQIVVSEELDSAKGTPSATRGASAVEDLKNKNVDAVNGARIIQSPIDPTEDAENNARKLHAHLVAQPAEIIRADLAAAAADPRGREYVALVVTRTTRRSIASGVLTRNDQRNARSKDVFTHLAKNLEATIRLENNPPSASGSDAKQVDTRMVALAKEMRQRLEEISGPSKAISYMESLEFQVYAFNNPSFFEFIRSSGPEPATLLRDLIAISSLQSKLQLESLKEQQTTNNLLSIQFLETQDDPERVAHLVNMKSKF